MGTDVGNISGSGSWREETYEEELEKFTQRLSYLLNTKLHMYRKTL